MRGADLILACVLSLLHGRHPAHEQCRTPYVEEVASAIRDASAAFHVPAEIIAAVARHESGFEKFAIGSRGEVGLMQIKRGGAVQGDYAKLRNQELADVHLNVWLGAAYLDYVRRRCHAHFLSRYNGSGCVASRYERTILDSLKHRRPARVRHHTKETLHRVAELPKTDVYAMYMTEPDALSTNL